MRHDTPRSPERLSSLRNDGLSVDRRIARGDVEADARDVVIRQAGEFALVADAINSEGATLLVAPQPTRVTLSGASKARVRAWACPM